MRIFAHLLKKVRRVTHSCSTSVRQHPITAISLSLLALGGIVLCIGLAFHKPIAAAIISVTNPEPPKERRAIDGVWVPKGLSNPPLVAVMIENYQDAQPLSGIDKASLVYEALVEATITRFMVVIPFPTDMVPSDDLIGPVRSVRPYYLTWATELGAMLIHVGGSPAALERIRGQGILTLNEFYNGKFFVRAKDRYAPHNTFTSTTKLAQAIGEKLTGTSLEKWSQSLPAWQYKEDTDAKDRGTTTAITIGYSEPYAVKWEYNKDTNSYTRMQWGGSHTTSTGTVLAAKNIAVVVQKMAVLDEIGRKQFTTEGTGPAYLFRDGVAIVGTWQKDSPSARMRLFDQSGNEMNFNAGPTWVEVVPVNTVIQY